MSLGQGQGSIYHMVSIHNLPSIFSQKAILSKQKLYERGISPTSIANPEVQQLRSRIFVFDAKLQKYRALHGYVPFYFATHTPMLYVQFRDGIQKDIVIFGVSRAILTTPGVIFTNGNATLQQLSSNRGERVLIIPATVNKPSCQRRYEPHNRPLGTNTWRSDFYSGITFLNKLDWSVINNKDSKYEDRHIKHAEVLIPDSVALSQVEEISVSTPDTEQRVNILIKSYGLQDKLPPAKYKPYLFF